MQEIRLNQKTKNIQLYQKDTNTLQISLPFVTIPPPSSSTCLAMTQKKQGEVEHSTNLENSMAGE